MYRDGHVVGDAPAAGPWDTVAVLAFAAGVLAVGGLGALAVWRLGALALGAGGG